MEEYGEESEIIKKKGWEGRWNNISGIHRRKERQVNFGENEKK